jgi:hypothetical protein
MRLTVRVAWVVLLMASVTPAARAQKRLLNSLPPDPPPEPTRRAQAEPAKQTPPAPPAPPARQDVEAPRAGGAIVSVSAAGQGLAIRTTVRVPDGGTALLGGYSQASESRSEYGAPILGKVPYLSRGFRNVGYGRSLSSRRASVTVRVIDLREEEFRQTGFRSR